MEERTTGRVFTAPDGTEYRPSMFVTLTLPSYGKVRYGVPVDPGSYDYRRAALDALLFPRLLDRFWQNLRRAAGYRVQYFSAIEAQRRLAPHLHAAIRGAIPRATIKAVARATYHQVWWPSFEQAVYVERVPIWDSQLHGYVDPDTRAVLPTWGQALDELDADPHARPAHVLRFGTQLDIQGLLGGSVEADQTVRYLCKYLTKAVADTYSPGPDAPADPAYQRHIDRLHEQVRWLPCSPRCANWLRYGLQPDSPGPGLVPGSCSSPAHERDNLGLGGRRVLVSRAWTGKTLTEHRADRAAVVRMALEAAGIEPPQARRMAADTLDESGQARYRWDDVPLQDRDYFAVLIGMIRQARAWREQYEAAKNHTGAGPPQGACGRLFGNHSPAASRSMPHLDCSVAVKGERSESRRDTKRSEVPLTATEQSRPSKSGRPPRSVTTVGPTKEEQGDEKAQQNRVGAVEHRVGAADDHGGGRWLVEG